jgi:cob(I)alamin adenosyltransferase
MGVYTKTGDKGTTGLYTGERVAKSSLRVESYGTIDELNSALGLARATCENEEVKKIIYNLQELNMSVMAELASLDGKSYIRADHIKKLERQIDEIEEKLPPQMEFIIAGSTKGGAALDLARTVARRAERLVWRLNEKDGVSENLLIALNRLSDLCFVLMRLEEHKS